MHVVVEKRASNYFFCNVYRLALSLVLLALMIYQYHQFLGYFLHGESDSSDKQPLIKHTDFPPNFLCILQNLDGITVTVNCEKIT